MEEPFKLRRSEPIEKNGRNVLSLDSARERHAIEASIDRMARDLEENPNNLSDVELITMLTELLNNPKGFVEKERIILYKATKKFLEINKDVALISVQTIRGLKDRAWPNENEHPTEKTFEQKEA